MKAFLVRTPFKTRVMTWGGGFNVGVNRVFFFLNSFLLQFIIIFTNHYTAYKREKLSLPIDFIHIAHKA